jgi:ribosome-binding factor A
MRIRQQRVANIIKRDISQIIQYEVNDPHIGFVTVTDVEVTNDFSYATIYVSFLGKQPRNDAGLAALNRAKGRIRGLLAQGLDIYKCPELIFKLDDSLNRGNRIDAILQAEAEKEPKA